MNHSGYAVKYGKKAISAFLVANWLYFFGLIETPNIAIVASPKIRSQFQLEQLVEKERRKISPQNNCNIFVALLYEDEARSTKLGNGAYKIEIGGFYANETTLRHELYHILDGHCDAIGESKSGLKSWLQKELKYFFWYEPQAIIYQSTGLKP